jgi:hypothetical protein
MLSRAQLEAKAVAVGATHAAWVSQWGSELLPPFKTVLQCACRGSVAFDAERSADSKYT